MYRSICFLCLILLAAGCAVGAPATPIPLPASVTIEQPQTGAIIYGPTLYLSGQAENLSAGQFRLTAVTASDETLIDTSVTVTDGQWTYESPNTYTGDPTELTLSALSPEGREFDVISIMLSNESQRPEGVFGMIVTPFDGDTVGGETLPVSGTASGLFEGTLNLDLEKPDGEVISSLVITVNNPNMIDEVPWQADIVTNEYRGPAVLRAYYQSANDGSPVTLDTVSITIGDAAG